MSLICKMCGKPFERGRKYCSKECYNRSKRLNSKKYRDKLNKEKEAYI